MEFELYEASAVRHVSGRICDRNHCYQDAVVWLKGGATNHENGDTEPRFIFNVFLCRKHADQEGFCHVKSQ